MNWLFEGPAWLIVLFGVLLVAMLAAGWLQTGRRELVYGMLGVAVLCIAALLVERLVVTDREAIEQTLRETARAVESNDVNQVLAFLHSEATQGRALASSELPKYRIEDVRIKQVTVTVEPDREPPEAIAEFNAVVVGSDREGMLGQRSYPRFVRVVFRKEGERWRVWDYAHGDPVRREIQEDQLELF